MATKSPFETIRLNAAGQEKSYQWYRQQVLNLGRNASSTGQVLRDTPMVTNIMPGEMYLFMYDPKHKDTLPYYDTMPLVLPFRQLPDGFLGINLHYLPYLARFNLLGELSKLATDKNMDENTRIKISWQILNSSTSYTMATACVKHYLKNQIKF